MFGSVGCGGVGGELLGLRCSCSSFFLLDGISSLPVHEPHKDTGSQSAFAYSTSKVNV